MEKVEVKIQSLYLDLYGGPEDLFYIWETPRSGDLGELAYITCITLLYLVNLVPGLNCLVMLKSVLSNYKIIFQDSDELSGKYMGTREKEERADRDRGPGKDKERGFREREKERKRSREEPTRGRNIQGTE